MKRYWIRSLREVTTEGSGSASGTLSPTLTHSFSSRQSLYYSSDPIEGSYFSKTCPQPPTASFHIEKNEEESPKTCANCATRLTFISSRCCDICNRTFCKTCCNSKLLRMSKLEMKS